MIGIFSIVKHETFFSSLDLVKVTLLNGNDRQDCGGRRISIAIQEKDSGKRCYSHIKAQILADSTSVWNTQDLGSKCRKTLFDPDKGMEVQIRTKDAQDPYCPKKVELEILDLNTNKPRYFCSQVKDNWDNWVWHVTKEERCFPN